MRLSPRLIRFDDPSGYSLCYHALRGSLYLLDPEHTHVLDMLVAKQPASLSPYQTDIATELEQVGYLVSSETDEYKFVRDRNEAWMKKVPGGGQLRLLNLMVSESCNFGCQHCLHKCSVSATPTHGERKLMDCNTAIFAFDAYRELMKRNGQEQLSVHFGSAEPLINWRTVKPAIQYIHRVCPTAEVAINTNLSLLTEEMAVFFRDHHVALSISLDGPPEGNDRIRVFSDGSGTFTTIMSKVNLLAEVGYPLDGFSITLNDLNFDFVTPDFIDWAEKVGFRGIATDIDLINTVNADRPVEQCVAKLLELKYACDARGMENFGTWTTAYHNLTIEPEDGMPTFCKAMKGQNISVNPEGIIFACGHTTTVLGNISRFVEVFSEHGAYAQLVENRLPGNDSYCYGCEIEGLCAGQCQITREVASSTGNGKDRALCVFYRLATAELLRDKFSLELSNLGKGGEI